VNDKTQHAIAGAAAALLGALLYCVGAMLLLAFDVGLQRTGIIPVPLICALIAGLTKEAADWLDNRVRPGTHTVDPWDVAATTAPGLVLSIALAIAVV
jgi:hypothetical protein